MTSDLNLAGRVGLQDQFSATTEGLAAAQNLRGGHGPRLRRGGRGSASRGPRVAGGGEYDKMEGMAANAQEPKRPRRKLTQAEKEERWADQMRGFIRLKPGTDEALDPRDQPRLDRVNAQLRELGFIK